MKKDIDRLMEERNLDVLFVVGSATHNPPMHYFTGNVHVNYAYLIKEKGKQPLLFCNPMEREEAARSGLEIRNLAEYKMMEIIKETGGDKPKATAIRMSRILKELGINSGRIAIYGIIEANWAFSIFSKLQELLPDVEIVGEIGDTVFIKAMETKEEDETARIRKMGQITTEVVGRTKKFLQSHKVVENVLKKEDGKFLTVGDVKSKINLWAAELGVENPHGTIFAIGRDAGVPHSSGNPTDIIELGKTIVFDIFLQEPGGGYHFDFTRTWCLGFAPDVEKKLYRDVRAVFDKLMEDVEVDMHFNELQQNTCEYFEELGHQTIRQNPLIEEGYVHGVGHGLGIRIHENPSSGSKEAILSRGVVVTIEPGLYYPSKGMGCRIEDTVYVQPDGTIEVLADFPHDLIVPMEA